MGRKVLEKLKTIWRTDKPAQKSNREKFNRKEDHNAEKIVFERLKAIHRPAEDIFEVIAKVPKNKEVEIETQPKFNSYGTEKFSHQADKSEYEITHFLFGAYGVERATFTVRCDGVERTVNVEKREEERLDAN